VKKLTKDQIIDYFHRSFTAMDGLWFMKVEEKYGVDVALALDNAVWEIFPKIQARELKAMMQAGSGIEALKTCFNAALTLKGFKYFIENEAGGKGFKVHISECPWHNTMIKAGREPLSRRIGDTICPTEYGVWAKEFADNIRYSLEPEVRICGGGKTCVMRFRIE
jgi:hypothetical protein